MVAFGKLNEEGVDESVHVIMKFPGDKIAMLSTSSLVFQSNTAELMGTKGFIQVRIKNMSIVQFTRSFEVSLKPSQWIKKPT